MSASKIPGQKLTVGLTGGIGSGKSAVSGLFGALGVDIIDADIMARHCVEPGTPALQSIRQRYGEIILNIKGELNRQKLREIIFHDPAEKAWLEALLHPQIRHLLMQARDASPGCYTMLVSPLLLETDQHELVDRVLVIDCEEHLQIQRATARDQSTEAAIKAIMATQLPRRERLARADDIIYNNGSLEALAPQVEKLHQKYLTLANAK